MCHQSLTIFKGGGVDGKYRIPTNQIEVKNKDESSYDTKLLFHSAIGLFSYYFCSVWALIGVQCTFGTSLKLLEIGGLVGEIFIICEDDGVF